MIRNRIAWLACAALACIGLAALPEAHAGLTCYGPYSSNLVSAVQETLAKGGFNPGAADGKWGPKSARALDAYQRSQRLRPTGAINGATLRALFGPAASAEAYGLARNKNLPSEVFDKECR